MTADRRLAFGQVAELYDRVRPSYPAALVNDVLEFAGARPGDWALEVGAGTGKATLLFADRGLRIVALEPSPPMAQLARRNTADREHVEIEEAEFERWAPTGRFRLTYSAQAWHWIAPEARYARAARAIIDGGALATFWNRPRWDASPLRDPLREVYARLAPELASPAGSGPMHPGAQAPRDWLEEWDAGQRAASGFAAPEVRTYGWCQRYSTEQYLGLLQTHSDHVILEPRRRQALLEAVGEAIDNAGGALEIEYLTGLIMARRTRGLATGSG